MSPFTDCIPLDYDKLRVSITCTSEIKIKPSVVWKFLKDLVGKDLSNVSMPVFVNEPCSILQKAAEGQYFLAQGMEKALTEMDPVKRLISVVRGYVMGFSQVPGRLNKPFNPLLGETFELVTPSFRFLAEMVSHHPPVTATHS